MKYGAGSLFAKSVFARFNSVFIVVKTMSGAVVDTGLSAAVEAASGKLQSCAARTIAITGRTRQHRDTNTPRLGRFLCLLVIRFWLPDPGARGETAVIRKYALRTSLLQISFLQSVRQAVNGRHLRIPMRKSVSVPLL